MSDYMTPHAFNPECDCRYCSPTSSRAVEKPRVVKATSTSEKHDEIKALIAHVKAGIKELRALLAPFNGLKDRELKTLLSKSRQELGHGSRGLDLAAQALRRATVVAKNDAEVANRSLVFRHGLLEKVDRKYVEILEEKVPAKQRYASMHRAYAEIAAKLREEAE